MKTATTIFPIVFGAIYLIFGLDFFLHFIPYEPKHTERVAAFKAGLMGVGYFYSMLKPIQIAGGLLLLANR